MCHINSTSTPRATIHLSKESSTLTVALTHQPVDIPVNSVRNCAHSSTYSVGLQRRDSRPLPNFCRSNSRFQLHALNFLFPQSKLHSNSSDVKSSQLFKQSLSKRGVDNLKTRTSKDRKKRVRLELGPCSRTTAVGWCSNPSSCELRIESDEGL